MAFVARLLGMGPEVKTSLREDGNMPSHDSVEGLALSALQIASLLMPM